MKWEVTDQYLVKTSRSLLEESQSSCFYITHEKRKTKVSRYIDRYVAPNMSVAESLHDILRPVLHTAHFPAELVGRVPPMPAPMKRRKRQNSLDEDMAALQKQEKKVCVWLCLRSESRYLGK